MSGPRFTRRSRAPIGVRLPSIILIFDSYGVDAGGAVDGSVGAAGTTAVALASCLES